jgi:hypothetical protein
MQGFSNFFGWQPPFLFLEILRQSRCKISQKRAFLWELFGKIDFKNSQFHRLATLFWKLATLKRVATPSLRTAGLCDHFGPHYK